MNLNQVIVESADIGRSVAFYERLGLELIVLTDDYARLVCPGGATFSVHLIDKPSPGGTLIYFECEDLDARCARLTAEGVVFDSPPTDQRWLWREARLSDPDGNRLCLYWAGENRVNPPWRIVTES
ncbi:MAG TPA: VOC family protein [Brevundimonas sp.]|uniref:VOC family protein n=1 Tax=Brevundimonas sp. TaxID=1871086 RepID=UPI002BA54946|nr:VOC family protein [Brevundimonas sp.]HRH21436.1 VOC family protein [Brevundimonas sp.]